MSRKLQLKRGVKAALPSLAEGEPALVTDEKKLYIGTNNGNKAISMDGHTHAPAESGADPAGSAAAVDSKLTQHAANRSNPHGVTVGQIGAVPSGRTVNNKSLSGNITLYASDIGAYTKAESLSEFTKTKIGLSASATPNAAFDKLSLPAMYAWRKRASSEFKIAYGGNTITQAVGSRDDSSAVSALQYANAVSLDQTTGAIILTNPLTVNVSYNAYSNLNIVKGKYWRMSGTSNIIYYTSQDAADAERSSYYNSDAGATFYSTKIYAKKGMSLLSPGGLEAIFSADVNCYPHSGVLNGYAYEFLGNFANQLSMGCNFESGTYLGTGVYGKTNPNTLTFGFVPQIVILSCATEYSTTVGILSQTSGFSTLGNLGVRDILVKTVGNTVTWYSSGSEASHQMNSGGAPYSYVAIG